MKKNFILMGMLTVGLAYAQTGKIGVNTSTPEATIDIQPSAANTVTTATTNEGMLIPRVSLARLNNVAATNLKESTLVYVNDLTGTTSTTTIDVTSRGFYYYSTTESKWVKMAEGTMSEQDLRQVGTNNHITQDAGVGGNGSSVGTGVHNIAIGKDVLFSNTIGVNNIGLGINALHTNQAGRGNIGIGANSLYSNDGGHYNVAVGENALYSTTSGTGNVALGTDALYRNTTGANNMAMGYNSLYNNTTGNGNIANGPGALYSNTTGIYNLAMGYQALYSNTTASYNIALGGEALRSNTTGINNIAIGLQALHANNSNRNIGVGNMVLANNTTGANNIGIGNFALQNASSSNNVAIGDAALANNTAGSSLAIGYRALTTNTTGGGNMGIGNYALTANTTGQINLAIGFSALSQNNIGGNNMAIGYEALYSNTSGNSNIGIGIGSLYTNTSGMLNLALGNGTLNRNTIGSYNIAMGNTTLYSNISGNNNTAIGYSVLYNNTTGIDNTAVGGQSTLRSNTTGSWNVALGSYAARALVTGGYNTSLGYFSMPNNQTGNYNIAVGYQAGNWMQGNGNIHIGNSVIGDNSTNLDNVIAIGNGIINTHLTTGTVNDNVILLGHNQPNSPNIGMGIYRPAEKLHVAGNVAIGAGTTAGYPQAGNYLSFEGTQNAATLATSFPNTDVLAFYRYDLSNDTSHLRLLIGDNEGSADAFSIGVRTHTPSNLGYVRGNINPITSAYAEKFRFQADGSAFKNGSNVWSVFSDIRIKENIKPYQRGLKEILQIKPVNFNYKKEANKGDETYVGVIAQELEKVVPTMVHITDEKVKGVENIKTVDGNEYTFMLINAVKELSEKVERLEAEIKTLKNKKK